MTREEAKELLPIIQAFVAGKQIQDSIDCVRWFDTDEINLEYEGQKIEHRIKPEPKYRPFKNRDECWNEMLKHQPFGWIHHRMNNFYAPIRVDIDDHLDFETFFTSYTFADRAPFGILEK